MESGVAITTEVVLEENAHGTFVFCIIKSGKIVNAYNALLMAENVKIN
jgi:hypothetical protein